jgi:peptide/nickel transport system permease protein
LIIGSRVSLTVALGSTLLSTMVAILIGLTSAYFQGRYDLVMQRFVDGLQSIPSLILAMVMVATLGASLTTVMVAIAVSSTATGARLVRAAALGVKQNQYVEAARACGATSWRIMLRHIFPNTWAPIIVFFSLSLGTAIIRESSLSFLGLGPPPPIPTWGSMLSGNARNYMTTAPWLAIAPGLCITLVVLSFNLVGDALRDVLDPRLRNS